jgi:hypothetical protein
MPSPMVPAPLSLKVQLSQMEGKFEEAKAYYSHSAVQASRTGMHEQAMEAKVAVRRVERSERVQATAKTTPA